MLVLVSYELGTVDVEEVNNFGYCSELFSSSEAKKKLTEEENTGMLIQAANGEFIAIPRVSKQICNNVTRDAFMRGKADLTTIGLAFEMLADDEYSEHDALRAYLEFLGKKDDRSLKSKAMSMF